MYTVESYTDSGINHVKKRKVSLTVGNYDLQSLATELQTQLTANTFFPNNTYVVSHSDSSGKLTISLRGLGNANVQIWSQQCLQANSSLWTDSTSNQVGTLVENDNCYAIIGFTEDGVMNLTHSDDLQGHAHVSTLPFHTIYLTSSFGLGASEDSIGPRESNSI